MLDDGRVTEAGSAASLLADSESSFAVMWAQFEASRDGTGGK